MATPRKKTAAAVATPQEKLLAQLAEQGISLKSVVGPDGALDQKKLIAAIQGLPPENQAQVVALLTEAGKASTTPTKTTRPKTKPAPTPAAAPAAASEPAGTASFLPTAGAGSTPIGEDWQNLVKKDGSFRNSGNAATAKALFNKVADLSPAQLAAELSRDEQELLTAYAYHLHADPATGGGGADKTILPLLNKTDIKGVVANLHQFQKDKVLRVEASGEGVGAGGATDTELAHDDLSQRTTDDHVARATDTATDPNVSISTATGDAVDVLATPKEIEALQAKLDRFEAADKKTNFRDLLRKNITGWTGLGKPQLTKTDLEAADAILNEAARSNPKLQGIGTANTPTGAKGGRAAVMTPKNAPVPLPIREHLNVSTVDELLAKYPSKYMEPGLRAAIQDLTTGDPEAYQAYLKEYTAKSGTGGEIPFGLTKEGLDRVSGAKSPQATRLDSMRTALSGEASVKLGEIEQKIADLQAKMPPTSAGGRPAAMLEKLQASLNEIKTTGVVPAKVGFLEQKLNQLSPLLTGNKATSAKNLAGIQKAVSEMEKFGTHVESATAAQLGARAEDVAGLLKGGKGAEAAARMGLAEGTTLGSMKNVTGTSFFEFLKNHPEKEVRAWAPKLKQAAAQGLGAGAEAGLLESLDTKVAAKGGIVRALGGKMNVAMMVAPLLFTLYSKMKESTEHNKQVELMQMQQQAAPTAKDLLERYRAQRFAEQGVNNMPPSPDFIRRLQSMGPQLTKSEVYIGPDRTEDNLRAMIAQSGEY